MQRFFAVLLLIALLISTTACSSSASPAATATPAPKAATTPAASTAQTAAPAATTKPAAAATTAMPAQAAPASAIDKLLTVADVEKITGLTGVRLAPYDPSKGAGGDLNFADKDDNLLLMVNTNSVGKTTYTKMRDDKRYSLGPLPGIGDEAFAMMGPFSQTEPIGIAFIKGTNGITLNSYLNMTASTKTPILYVNMDQMTQAAKLIASRM